MIFQRAIGNKVAQLPVSSGARASVHFEHGRSDDRRLWEETWDQRKQGRCNKAGHKEDKIDHQ